MKILLTGGGTGGHFYPLIAVAEAIKDIVAERKLLEPQLYYAAPEPYDEEALFANNITFVKTRAGKLRRYFTFWTIIDFFKTCWGVTVSVFRIFFLYPDVVFSKGGYASFPTLLAARLFRIPVVIHESDTVPGRVNTWAGKFAERVALSYPQAVKFFPEAKTAVTGNPIRKALLHKATEGAHEYLKLERGVPVIFVIGGSQGSVTMNDCLLRALAQLVERYQIIHQTGAANLTEAEQIASVVLKGSPYASRYKPFGTLNELAMRMAAGAANLVISRAGSTIFEIAAWGVPSILVPIPNDIVKDQTTNAFTYARTGAAVVIEQNNLSPNLLVSEIRRIMDNPDLYARMALAAQAAASGDAARIIADELLTIALGHEPA
jgi:UDP-N-acetylglucosamine--N-acetylmuramyl-(pentapeptide) pyrophosphoryl-undecaprenol N-acetylglucosamine transferase